MGDCIQAGIYVKGEGLYMYCKLCCKFYIKNHQKQSKVCNREACTAIPKYVLGKHEASVLCREALQPKHACHVVKVQGGIALAGGTLYLRKMLCLMCCNFSLPRIWDFCTYIKSLKYFSSDVYVSLEKYLLCLCNVALEIGQAKLWIKIFNIQHNWKLCVFVVCFPSTGVASMTPSPPPSSCTGNHYRWRPWAIQCRGKWCHESHLMFLPPHSRTLLWHMGHVHCLVLWLL